jgi:nitrite reductase (NADH) large subunit
MGGVASLKRADLGVVGDTSGQEAGPRAQALRKRKRRVLVIGGGVAGVAASLASAGGGAETVLVESSKRVGLLRSRLPSLLSEGLSGDDLITPDADSIERAGIEVRVGETIESIVRTDIRESAGALSSTFPSSSHPFRVETSDSRLRSVEFDSVVICTGAAGIVPPLRGMAKENVFVLRDPSDYSRLFAELDGLKTVGVSGPIPLALKLGELLAAKGRRIDVYCGRDGLERQFSPGVAKVIRDLAKRGNKKGGAPVSLIDGSPDSILGVERAEAILSNGAVRVCDSVIILPRSAPSYPMVDCQRGSGGGLLVDPTMSTSSPGLFAAGDCAEIRFKSGSVPARLHSTSKLGGEVAGTNASGGGRATASPSWAVQQTYFGLECCSAGLGEAEASAMGLNAGIEVGEFPGARGGGGRLPGGGPDKTFVSMVFDRATHEIYGVQVAGWQASSLASAASLIVAMGLTAEQLAHAEFPYSPGSTHEDSPIALTARRIHGRERPT